MRHLKSGFWPARRIASLADLDEQYRDWRDGVCNRRLHSTGRFAVGERLAEERAALRALPPTRFDYAYARTSRVPLDGYLRYRQSFYRAPEALVHQRVESKADRDGVWICHRGEEVERYGRSYEPGTWLPAPRLRPPRSSSPPSARPSFATTRRSAHEPQGQGARRRRAPALPAGQAQGAARARAPRADRPARRADQWPYEQFLEALLEAEVFARDASGAPQRIRAAQFPARKTLEDFDWQAQPAAERPLAMHLAQLAWIEEHTNVFRRPRWTR